MARMAAGVPAASRHVDSACGRDVGGRSVPPRTGKPVAHELFTTYSTVPPRRACGSDVGGRSVPPRTGKPVVHELFTTYSTVLPPPNDGLKRRRSSRIRLRWLRD